MPDIAHVVTTYFPEGEVGIRRANEHTAALRTWIDHLHYDRGRIVVVMSDDGSPIEKGLPYTTRQERKGVGASLNAGFKHAFDQGIDLILYCVDDWALKYDFDLTPWAELLLKDDSIGMVRLGPPHPDLTGKVEHLSELGWCLRLNRHHFAFGHRPALYHRRMIEAYGWFKEGVNAYECEQDYNERFCRQDQDRAVQVWGPSIVLALPTPWDHRSTVELGDVVPQ